MRNIKPGRWRMIDVERKEFDREGYWLKIGRAGLEKG